jgi:hypothetical protein
MPKILSVIASKDTKYCVYNKYHRKLEVYVHLLSRRSQRSAGGYWANERAGLAARRHPSFTTITSRHHQAVTCYVCYSDLGVRIKTATMLRIDKTIYECKVTFVLCSPLREIHIFSVGICKASYEVSLLLHVEPRKHE